MKKKKNTPSRIILYIIIAAAVMSYRLCQNTQGVQQKKIDGKTKAKIESIINENQSNQQEGFQSNRPFSTTPTTTPSTTSSGIASIAELTEEEVVINYLRKNGDLPPYYITKEEARKAGWESSKGNLCDILPGKAIGGDHFGNFERLLPEKPGRKYREADINYNCGSRNPSRVVFSNDGLIYTTDNHYRSFKKH